MRQRYYQRGADEDHLVETAGRVACPARPCRQASKAEQVRRSTGRAGAIPQWHESLRAGRTTFRAGTSRRPGGVRGRAGRPFCEPQVHGRIREVIRRVLLDTGPLIAFIDQRDRNHAWVKSQFADILPPLLTCEAVLTEACYMARR